MDTSGTGKPRNAFASPRDNTSEVLVGAGRNAIRPLIPSLARMPSRDSGGEQSSRPTGRKPSSSRDGGMGTPLPTIELDETSELRNKIEAQYKEINELKTSLKAQVLENQRILSEKSSEMARSNEVISALQDQIYALTEAEKQRKAEDARAKLAESHETAARSGSRIEVGESEVSRLRTELAARNEEIVRLKKAPSVVVTQPGMQRRTAAGPQLDELNNEIEELKKANQKLITSNQEYRTKDASLSKAKVKADRKAAAAEAAAIELQAKLDTEKAVGAEARRQLADYNRLKAEEDTIKAKMEIMRLAHEEEMAALRAQLAKKDKAIAKARDANEAITAERNEQVDLAQGYLDEKSKKEVELAASREREVALQEELAEKQQELQRLKTEKERENKEKEEAKSAELASRDAAEAQKLAEKDGRIKERDDRIAALEAEIAKLRVEMQKQQEIIAQQQEDIDRLELQIEDLKEKLSRSSSQASDMERALSERSRQTTILLKAHSRDSRVSENHAVQLIYGREPGDALYDRSYEKLTKNLREAEQKRSTPAMPADDVKPNQAFWTSLSEDEQNAVMARFNPDFYNKIAGDGTRKNSEVYLKSGGVTVGIDYIPDACDAAIMRMEDYAKRSQDGRASTRSSAATELHGSGATSSVASLITVKKMPSSAPRKIIRKDAAALVTASQLSATGSVASLRV